MSAPYTHLIVGGGIVGLATALRILETNPRASVLVLEKEPRVGAHQSTHNSGVLHCGLYYKPGSMKARLAVDGIRQMTAFCRDNDIPHEICGKVVVATAEDQVPRLEELVRRGHANGLTRLVRLDRAGLQKIEPHATGVAAVQVPDEGIVDYEAVVATMARLIEQRGGRVLTNQRAAALQERNGGWVATTATDEFETGFLINCAGLHCDRVSALAGERRAVRILPFRGEYYKLTAARSGLVRNLIYPVPDPAFPFLGVHFTRLIHGGVECGPNAVLAFAREGYRRTNINVRDLADALSFPGLWRFLRKYPRMAVHELAQSFSRERFCENLRRMLPDLRPEDLEPGGAGVRAQAMSREGDLVQDFSLIRRPRALHVLNAPSPAATASLAIGGHIAELIAA